MQDHRHWHKLNPATSEYIGDWWQGTEELGGHTLSFGRDDQGGFMIDINGSTYPVVHAIGWHLEKYNQRYLVPIGNSWYIPPVQHKVVPDDWFEWRGNQWNAAGQPTDKANCFDRRCASCHFTGFNVRYLEATGEWQLGYKETNVHCEACHGPGWDHSRHPKDVSMVNPSELSYERQVEVCGQCHSRGDSTVLMGPKKLGFPWAADGAYVPGKTLADYLVLKPYDDEESYWQETETGPNHSIDHHQEYNDFILSKHYAAQVACTDCHNAHKKDEPYTDTVCTRCHIDKNTAEEFMAHAKHPNSVARCIDCHMPFIAKSAIKWDLRDHVFDVISPQLSLDMLNEGKEAIPNSCLNGGCHSDLSLSSVEDLQARVSAFEAMFGGD